MKGCQNVSAPRFRKNRGKLERVHRRATKIIRALQDMTYEESLKGMEFFVLRREDGRVLDTLSNTKIAINTWQDLMIIIMVVIKTWHRDMPRSNRLKLQQRRARRDIKKKFLTMSMVIYWDRLPREVWNFSHWKFLSTGETNIFLGWLRQGWFCLEPSPGWIRCPAIVTFSLIFFPRFCQSLSLQQLFLS